MWLVNEATCLAWNCQLKKRLSDIVSHLRNNCKKTSLLCHFKMFSNHCHLLKSQNKKQERFLKWAGGSSLFWTEVQILEEAYKTSFARDYEKVRKSCEHGPQNGKLSSTKKDGEATTEEVLGSIVTYSKEEILNTFKDDMASENTKKSTSTSVRRLQSWYLKK